MAWEEEPGADQGPAGGDGLLALAVGMARSLHGPESVETKLAWLLEELVTGAEADVAAYVSFEAELVVSRPASASAGAALDSWTRSRAGLREALGKAEAIELDGLCGLERVLVAAVASADGWRRGALVLGTTEARPLGRRAPAVALTLAAHFGVALDNAQTLRRLRELEASQREVVHQLQEAVRPSTPQLPDIELGVYYLSADPEVPTGGDLYDWQRLPDGDVHLSIVDVLGKGVAATKDAVAVTHALRLLVLDGVPLEDLVRRADQILTSHDPNLVATVQVIRYRPETGDLAIAGGGHPPLLLLRAEGTAELVYAPGIPIGWPGAGSDEIVSLTLGRSDTVVLYTDGLIEPGKDILVGLDALVRAGREVSDYPAEHLARSLVHRAIAGGQRRDDSVAVVLRRRSSPEGETHRPLPPFSYTFHSNTASVALARHLLADWLSFEPIDQTVVDDLVLIANELCANAVEADPEGEVVLRARVETGDVVVEVEDRAGTHPGLRPSVGDQPDPLDERGRGLYLVGALSDILEVGREGGRTIVRCRKRAVAPTS